MTLKNKSIDISIELFMKHLMYLSKHTYANMYTHIYTRILINKQIIRKLENAYERLYIYIYINQSFINSQEHERQTSARIAVQCTSDQ